MKAHDLSRSYKTLELSERRLEIVERKIANSSEPQLVMKPRLVGICRSDIKEFLGTRTVRHDFGHEILAEVVSNTDTRLPNTGALVVLDPHVTIHRSSGFGELIVASASIERLTNAFIKVPSSIADDKLIFTEPLACAHHCVSNLLRFEHRKHLEGLSIGILGAGMTGALIGLLCKHYGATVTMINRSKERLDFLESTSIFSANELSLSDKINREFDVIIPTTTFLFPEVLDLCEKIVKDSGLILLYGGTKAGDGFPGVNDIDIDDIRRSQSTAKVATVRKKFRLCGTHGATTDDFKAAIKLLRDSPRDFPVEKLISHRIKLEQVPEMIAAMTREEILGKTIVSF